MAAPTELELRPALDGDEAQILDLLRSSLGWLRDASPVEFFAWKHKENPFGRSPAWVAVDDGRVVGFRTFLRWRFRDGGGTVDAVRAVDTATDPAYRGRGIFRDLTLAALDSLAEAGAAFVFNTPNDSSRPGYLKMGWRVVGRLPVHVRGAGARGWWSAARSRSPAALWSTPTTMGRPVGDVLLDGSRLQALLDSQPPTNRLQTDRSLAYLAWRYGFEVLAYRAFLRDDDLDGGVVIGRLRQRGPGQELAICEVLAPGGEPGAARALVRAACRASGADHAVQVSHRRVERGFLPAIATGPILTERALQGSRQSSLEDWSLSLGDVELF